MTPAQLAALSAIAGLLEKFGNWKAGSVIAAVAFLPDVIFVVVILTVLNKFAAAIGEMRRQHASFEIKYDNNVELVKQITRIAESLQEVVILNTQTMQGVKDRIDSNLFCPLMRKDQKVEKAP